MITTIELVGNELTIRTEANRDLYLDPVGIRAVDTYHDMRAMQAIEDAVSRGYTYLGHRRIHEYYWNDGVLADRDTGCIYSVFIMRLPAEKAT